LQDKAWRLTHLYKIRTKSGDIVTFVPNLIQLRHIQERGGQRYSAILKARQFGMTTLYAIDLLDESLWVSGNVSAIVAHEAKKLPEYFQIVERAFENLPAQLQPKTKTNTKYRYDFTTRFDGAALDSSIFVTIDVRGGTVHNLHITESAWIKDRQALNAATKQAVPLTGRISEETTGHGFNHFYDFYQLFDAIPKDRIGEMDYKTYFYAWWENPEYTLPGTLPIPTPDDKLLYGDESRDKALYKLSDGQLLWRRWKIRELSADSSKSHLGLSGLQLFFQEYPATKLQAFQSGAGNIFDAELVDSIKPRNPIPNQWVKENRPEIYEEFISLNKLGFVFWKLPSPGKKYVVGVDPSDGNGADSTDIDIWDKDGIEQVAQYYGKIRPDEGAEIAARVCNFFNGAYIGVENNMLSFILELSKIYDHYYFTTTIDERTTRRTKKLGWRTDSKSRDVMIDDFIKLFEESHSKINSRITLGEMKTFVKKENGKREHADGKFDDALFGGFVAIQMIKMYRDRPRIFAVKPTGF